MVAKSSIALKALQWFLTIVEFGCAAVILAIFSYFLATLQNHGLRTDTYIRAVEGISGVAVVYTLAGLVLLWCVAGVTVFALLAILLDVAFAGAFVYVAYVNRGGATSCRSYVNTPFGSGFANTDNKVDSPRGGITILPSLASACRLQKACFAVAIIAIFFFLISAFVEVLLMKSHRKDKRYGPSPANNYTAGAGKRKFWQRKQKPTPMHDKVSPDALPIHATPADVRTSYAPVDRTSYATESTAVGADPTYSKYGPSHGTLSDGYQAPMGTAVTGHTTAPYPQALGHTQMPVAAHHQHVNPAANY